MTNPTDPAAVEIARQVQSIMATGWVRPNGRAECGGRLIQSYGDQREAAARADERARVAELEAQVKRMEFDLEAAQCLMDSQYKAGVKLGWNLCATDDEAGYQRVTSGTEHIARLKRIQADRAAHFPSALAEDDGKLLE